MVDFTNLFNSAPEANSDYTISESDILEFWTTSFPSSENTFIDEEAKAIFSASFLYYSGNAKTDRELAFEPGGWKIQVSGSILKTSLVAASLAGVLYLSGFNTISGYVLPAVLPLLVDIEKVKLKKSEEYILAELRLNPEIKNKALTPEEIFDKLDESLKSQISLTDFIDFMDKLHISGDVTLVGKENRYIINETSTLKITFT